MRRKADGFLHFLKAFSWETDLWIALGYFTVKKNTNVKLEGEICIQSLSENWLSWNENVYVADNHNYRYMCHTCAKGF